MADNEPSKGAPGAGHNPTDFFAALFGRIIGGILSPDENTTWRDHVKRLWIGAAGGFFYTALKNYFGAGIGVYGLLEHFQG